MIINYIYIALYTNVSKRIQYCIIIITPVTGYIESCQHMKCTLSTPWGAFQPVLPFKGAHMLIKHINHLILPGTHLYTWVESSNAD